MTLSRLHLPFVKCPKEPHGIADQHEHHVEDNHADLAPSENAVDPRWMEPSEDHKLVGCLKKNIHNHGRNQKESSVEIHALEQLHLAQGIACRLIGISEPLRDVVAANDPH